MAEARKIIAALVFLAFGVGIAAAPWPAGAQTPTFDFSARDERTEISADSIEYRYADDVYVAEGNVHVVQGGRSLFSRWATFSARTRQGVASGDVIYRDGGEVLHARFAQFGLDDHDGVVLGADLDLGEKGMRIAAEELVRTGKDRYRIFDGRFTSCRCEDPDSALPWEMVAEASDVEVGGYGSSRNATVEILGVPVIWLPWVMYPVKSQRQSGLLMPDFQLGGRNGFASGLPVFWAPLRNVNVLVTPSISTKRGFKQDVEIETVYGERSRTQVRAAFSQENDDRYMPLPASRTRAESLAPQPNINAHYIHDRGFVALEHDQDLPGDVRLKIDGTWISDNEYVFDYDDIPGRRRDRFLESVAFAARTFGSDGRLGVQAASFYADDLQSREGLDRDAFLLQRYADIEAQWLTGTLFGLEGLTGGFDADYEFFGRRKDASNVLRRGGALPVGGRFYDVGIDATTRSVVSGATAIIGHNSGVFEEGEPLADQGHRLTLHPRLGLPLRLLGTFETFTEVGYRQTMYWTKQQGYEGRAQVTGRSEIAMRLSRDYDRGSKPKLRHELTPKLEWALVDGAGERSQRNNPLFSPRTKREQSRLRQRAFDSIVLDSADVVRKTNRVSFRIDNRLYQGTGGGRRLAGEFGIGFDHDFHRGNTGHLVAEGRRIALGPAKARFQIAYEPGKGKLDEGYAELNTPLFGKARAVLRYRYLRQAPEFFELFNSDVFNNGGARTYDRLSQASARFSVPFFDRFVLGYSVNYSFAGSQFLTNSGTLDYISKCDCWAVGVRVSNSRNDELRIGFRYSIIGVGDNIRNPFKAGRRRMER